MATSVGILNPCHPSIPLGNVCKGKPMHLPRLIQCANTRAPAIFFKRTINVSPPLIGGIGPTYILEPSGPLTIFFRNRRRSDWVFLSHKGTAIVTIPVAWLAHVLSVLVGFTQWAERGIIGGWKNRVKSHWTWSAHSNYPIWIKPGEPH